MPYEVKIPTVGESVTEVAIHQWLKKEGDHVEKDEPLAELETDKASVELPSPVAGRVAKLLKGSGDSAQVGEVIAHVEEDNGKPAAEQVTEPTPAKGQAAPDAKPTSTAKERQTVARSPDVTSVPAPQPEPQPQQPLPAPPAPAPGSRGERITPMTPIRRTIAKRLVQAQQTMALLTTFNEADMSNVMDLRRRHGEAFLQRHGVKLGFMSFFVRAVVAALKEIPALNCEIRDQHIVHHDYYDVGIAISTSYGLVVPVIRDADRLSFGEIEQAIVRFAQKAEAHQLDPDDLSGGTFTISNGGVFGSLLSTPIVNPPQSGVLGMHTIQERPVARDGQVVIRPMMYLALTYDHRIVDGRQSVTFLKRVKQYIEDPALLTLET